MSLMLLASTGVAKAEAPARRVEFPDAAQPRLALGTQKHVWLAYGSGKQVFAARSVDGGETFAAAVKIMESPDLRLGMRRGPRIAVGPEGVTVTVMTTELLAFHSDDDGRSWSQPVVVNDVPQSAREGLHDVAANGKGELYAAWLDLRNEKMELWGASSRDGGKTWGNNQRIYRSPGGSICECCHPSVLFDADGNLAVMWRNSLNGSRDLWMITRRAGQTEFGSPRKLGEGTWKLAGCPMDGGRLLAFGGGEFGAVWQRAGEIFLVRGESAETRLGAGKQPVAVVIGGEPVVWWQSGAGLVSNEGTQSPIRDARFPAMISLSGGDGIVLAYERTMAGEKTTDVVVERLAGNRHVATRSSKLGDEATARE
jgi:hypothetical protein